MTLQIMEQDILNYSPTVMFRGTPCTYDTVYCTWDKKIMKNKETHNMIEIAIFTAIKMKSTLQQDF